MKELDTTEIKNGLINLWSEFSKDVYKDSSSHLIWRAALAGAAQFFVARYKNLFDEAGNFIGKLDPDEYCDVEAHIVFLLEISRELLNLQKKYIIPKNSLDTQKEA